MSGRLVAVDLPGGPAFVDALRDVWDAGDAAFPVDQRLPHGAKAALSSTTTAPAASTTAPRSSRAMPSS